MSDLINSFSTIKSGDVIKITYFLELPSAINKKVTSRTQIYEGLIISKRNRAGQFPTVTVRKTFPSGAVEKTLLLNSPWVKSIQILSSVNVRQSKLYYLREKKGKLERRER